MSARLSNEEAQARAQLAQRKLELRESRHQSLLQQQKFFMQSQQNALTEFKSGLLSQDEYRELVKDIRMRADKGMSWRNLPSIGHSCRNTSFALGSRGSCTLCIQNYCWLRRRGGDSKRLD